MGVPNGSPAKPNTDAMNAKYQPIFFGIIRKKIDKNPSIAMIENKVTMMV